MARILLVEDESSFAEALTMLLAAEGYEVTAASNGSEALQVLEQGLPDLIISDYMMPSMNGLDMAERARATPRWSSVPILLMSAIDLTQRRIEPLLYDAFVQKPADIEHLLAVIRQLLSHPDK